MSTEYNFQKLTVYQDALDLVENLYRITQDFPDKEQFGITAQIRRAALSVPLNIAEGKGRYHTKVLLQFLYQSRGSLYELMALAQISQRLKYLSKNQEQDLLKTIDNLSIKLNNLINSLK